jgi:hypothetical protein
VSDGTELEPLPDDLRALIEAEKGGGEPPGAIRERVLLRLVGTFTLSTPAGDGGKAPPAGPAASGIAHGARLWGASRVLRTAAIFLTGAATGGGAVHVLKGARERPVPALVGSDRTATVTAPASRAEPTPIPAPAPPSTSPAAAPSAAPVARLLRSTRANGAIAVDGQGDDRLAAERSLLEIARVALVRGQAAGALAALARHARQFPSGALAEEREGLLVQALVDARQYDRARERAARFNQRYPRSLFAPVVEQALASIPVTERPAGPKQETP